MQRVEKPDEWKKEVMRTVQNDPDRVSADVIEEEMALFSTAKKSQGAGA